MRLKTAIAAAIGSTLFAAAPAMAWSNNTYTQPASNDIAVWAYPSKSNFCPAGLQPVVVGGVICCGQPTHVGYQSNNHPKANPKPRAYKPRAHKPHAKPYVAYEKGYVATGKGYDEGYRE